MNFDDGRENRGKYSAGSTVSIGTDNYRQTYNSYSASLAIKPKFDLGNGKFVTADLGIHRWKQSETYKYVGAGGEVLYHYDDWDTFYGIGAGIKKGDFEVSANYKHYDMYYDAEIIGASLKYIF